MRVLLVLEVFFGAFFFMQLFVVWGFFLFSWLVGPLNLSMVC